MQPANCVQTHWFKDSLGRRRFRNTPGGADQRFFERHPERTYRVRLALPCERVLYNDARPWLAVKRLGDGTFVRYAISTIVEPCTCESFAARLWHTLDKRKRA